MLSQNLKIPVLRKKMCGELFFCHVIFLKKKGTFLCEMPFVIRNPIKMRKTIDLLGEKC